MSVTDESWKQEPGREGYPGVSIPRSTYGSVGLAAWRATALEAALGADHPATRAAPGRWRALAGHLPQKYVHPSIEAVAWHREMGERGLHNRSMRRHAAYPVPRCIHGRSWDACDECSKQKNKTDKQEETT